MSSRFDEILDIREEMVAYANALTSDRDSAEDLVQETMLRLWMHIDKVDACNNPKALAYTVMHNLFIDSRRHDKYEKEYKNHQERVPDLALADDDISHSESKELVNHIINKLPPLQQRIIRLKELDGYSVDEIEKMTGCSYDSIRQHLSRARRQMRRIYLSIAATACIVAGLIAFWPQHDDYAIIDGRKTTDKALIQQEAMSALDNVSIDDEEYFDALNFDENEQ